MVLTKSEEKCALYQRVISDTRRIFAEFFIAEFFISSLRQSLSFKRNLRFLEGGKGNA